jgi:hypothetical protein
MFSKAPPEIAQKKNEKSEKSIDVIPRINLAGNRV